MFADQLKRVDADLVRAMQTVKVCKEQRETIRDELVALMGGYVSAKADGISITRYIQDGSIDWKAVAMQFDPDLSDEKYGAYRKAGGGRVRLTVDTDATTDSASLDEVLD
jgi:pyridoxal/pyridoxine/pyridoxamine kinase